ELLLPPGPAHQRLTLIVPREGPFRGRPEDADFGAERFVHGRDRHAGFGGQGVHGGAVIPALGEHAEGRVEHPPAGGRGLLPADRRSVGPCRRALDRWHVSRVSPYSREL